MLSNKTNIISNSTIDNINKDNINKEYETENCNIKDKNDKPFSGCLFFSANALARLTTKAAEKAFKPLKISASQAYILMIILKQPGIKASELANKMILNASTITRLLDKLEKLNYITKKIESKFVYIYPTELAQQSKTKLEECGNNLTNFYKSNIDCNSMKNATDISFQIALKLEKIVD